MYLLKEFAKLKKQNMNKNKDPLESQIGISMDSASKNRSMSSMAAYSLYDYSVAQGGGR